MAFNLGERSLTVNVKNKTLSDPENTTFSVKDYKGEDLYKGTYFIPDIKKIDTEQVDLYFNTLHCNYHVGIKVNPNNYNSNVDIVYGHKTDLSCGISITPASMKKDMVIQIKEVTPPIKTISLNDLAFQHYASIFMFGLVLAIGIGIKIMDKKKLLINSRD